MKLTLNRFFENENTTLGCINIDGKAFFTLENAWKNNERTISCIPAGEYEVIKHMSPSQGHCFKLLNVKNRDHILMHPGNTHKNTKGCILVGLSAGMLDSLPAVLSSKKAMRELMANLSESFLLTIKDIQNDK